MPNFLYIAVIIAGWEVGRWIVRLIKNHELLTVWKCPHEDCGVTISATDKRDVDRVAQAHLRNHPYTVDYN